MKQLFDTLPLVLLATAIALSPSYSAGVIEGGRIIEIKAEDILIVLLAFFWIIQSLISKKRSIQKPPLFFPIMAWLGVGAFSVLLNIILANIGLSRGFFFFLKEIEFFIIYFYVFSQIKSMNTVKYMVRVWLVLGAINIGWILYEIITGLQITYYYGPTAFAEPGGPFPSGGFFLILFLFLLNIFIFYYLNLPLSRLKKTMIALLASLPLVGVISSGSVTSFFGLIPALLLTFFLYLFKAAGLKALKITILSLSSLAVFFIVIFPLIPGSYRVLKGGKISTELQTSSGSSRLSIWKDQLMGSVEKPLYLIFGFGKSFILKEQQPHNQYLQNLIDTGIVGSAIFLALMVLIVNKAFTSFAKRKNPLIVGVSAGLLTITLAMAVMSIGAEAFRVVKIAEIYWFFVALTMATLVLNKKQFNW